MSDERRVDLVPEPEVRRHVSPSVGHSMDLGLFQVTAGMEHQVANLDGNFLVGRPLRIDLRILR